MASRGKKASDVFDLDEIGVSIPKTMSTIIKLAVLFKAPMPSEIFTTIHGAIIDLTPFGKKLKLGKQLLLRTLQLKARWVSLSSVMVIEFREHADWKRIQATLNLDDMEVELSKSGGYMVRFPRPYPLRLEIDDIFALCKTSFNFFLAPGRISIGLENTTETRGLGY